MRNGRFQGTFRRAPPFLGCAGSEGPLCAGSAETRRCIRGNISSCRRIMGTMMERRNVVEFLVIHLEGLAAFR